MATEANLQKKNQHKPLKMIAKFFNKGKRTSSVPEVNTTGSIAESNVNTVNSELEALHLSRTDNPYLEILSSQDNLDQTSPCTPPVIASIEAEKSSVLMSPESISPTRSYAGSKEYSLSEIHSHLVRSPPPITWPLSPRSNGTFSPDSSDMDVDNPMMNSTTISPPTRGYSPYNRSQSEEHILSPCRELLKSSEFSPVRGTTPELLAISMTAEGGCISPYRDFDVRSDRRVGKAVGRCASFISTSNMSTSGAITGNGRNFSGGSTGNQSSSLRNSRAAQYNRSSNVYYTMNFGDGREDSADQDMDSEELLSPNRNQMTYSFGMRSSRRSIGGLSLSPMSMSITGPPTAPVMSSQPKSGGFFASWRRSYRLRSKSSSSSAHNSATNTGRKKDTKSMENLLQNERPVPRYSLDCEDELDEESINN